MKSVILIKKIIEKRIRNSEKRIDKKQTKIRNLSDWYWCIVCANKHFDIPFKKRIKMYLKGFTSDQYYFYNLEKNDPKDYLTEMQRWKSRQINGKYNIIFDDKRLFFEVFNNYFHIPQTIGFISNGTFQNYKKSHLNKIEDLLEIIKNNKKLVFRRTSDGGGRGVAVVEFNNNNWYINNETILEKDLKIELENCNNHIISEYLNQLEYSNKIYSKSVNTIRVVVINNGDGTYCIPIAVHRFGTSKSGVVDNLCRGGIVASIDVNTGVLGNAYSYYSIDPFEKHPDTKEQIKGIKVPNWDLIKEKLLDVSTKFPYINLMAWDVVSTEDGFSIIEGNTSTDLCFLQREGGIAESKLAEFYKKYGI